MELMPIYHSVVADLEIDPAHPEAVASGRGRASPRPSLRRREVVEAGEVEHRQAGLIRAAVG